MLKRLRKGSAEARAFMAKLRAMRGHKHRQTTRVKTQKVRKHYASKTYTGDNMRRRTYHRRRSGGIGGGVFNLKKIAFGAAAAYAASMLLGNRYGVIQDAGAGYLVAGVPGAIGGVAVKMILNKGTGITTSGQPLVVYG